MHRKKESIALILAGGQGSRLSVLTRKVAKPAVPFGGKYRIIDFTLSNCINSGIDTVGVLTQYQPLELNSYIGNGAAWDLDRNSGGVAILPPYMTADDGRWYKGTANAVYQNSPFIEQYDPDYVVILSGDHIYKMDYSEMIAAHKQKQAACTIAVINVALEEASRFGIMSADSENRIFEFEEKPKCPKSTKASMGVYVFSWKVLREYLKNDDKNPASSNDFGKNIIPEMLAAGERMYAYDFEGYWKDVGTLHSLWEANMELLGRESPIHMTDKKWRIYARTGEQPPHFISSRARVSNSIVTEGSRIYGTVENSVISAGVLVEEGAVVRDAVVFPDAVIKKNAVVEYGIIGQEAVIGEDSVLGRNKNVSHDDIEPSKMAGYLVVVGNNVNVGAGAKVLPGEILGNAEEE